MMDSLKVAFFLCLIVSVDPACIQRCNRLFGKKCNSNKCKQCMKPCQESKEIKNCAEFCDRDITCMESCKTLPKQKRISTEYTPPSPVNNITTCQEINGDGVDVTVYWRPPDTAVSRIRRYRVYWSERLDKISPIYIHLREHRKMVASTRYSLKLPMLKSNTRYFIQVQAFAKGVSGRWLRGERASLYIRTKKIPSDDEPTTAAVIPDTPTAQWITQKVQKLGAVENAPSALSSGHRWTSWSAMSLLLVILACLKAL